MDATILRLLRAHPIPLTALAEHCGITTESLRTRLHTLEAAGFSFTTHPVDGITLAHSPDHLIGDNVLSLIPQDRCPASITVYHSTRSTNDLAHHASTTNIRTPAVFIAEQQTAGRGRNGRTWESKPGLGLWMSLLLRPSSPQTLWHRIPTAAATLIASALRSTLQLPIQIKWPNDLWLGHAKLGGLIVETGTAPTGPFAVLGIGLNILHSPNDFPPELRTTATSLQAHLPSIPLQRNHIAANLLNALADLDSSLADQPFQPLLEQTRSLSCVLGRPIELSLMGTPLSGQAIDLDPEGRLLLLTQDGSIQTLHSGEVTRVRPASYPA